MMQILKNSFVAVVMSLAVGVMTSAPARGTTQLPIPSPRPVPNPRPIPNPNPHPIPNPPGPIQPSELFCVAGGQNWMHVSMAVQPDGKTTVGPLMFQFRKADKRVSIDANLISNLQKGECGYREQAMASTNGSTGTFFDENIKGKSLFIGLDATIEGHVGDHVLPMAFSQTFTVQGYEAIRPGTLFKVNIHADPDGTLAVDTGTTPTILK